MWVWIAEKEKVQNSFMSKYELFTWMTVIILRSVVMENYFLKNVHYKNSSNVNVPYRMFRFGSFK